MSVDSLMKSPIGTGRAGIRHSVLEHHAGGEGPTGLRSDCHTYDLDSDSWSIADSLAQPRGGHVAVALAGGRVLIIDGDGNCELFA